MLSRFKKWLNYDRLKLGTADQWDEWESEFIKRAPIRYWLTHRLPYLTWRPLKWRYDDIRNWIRYRIKRYHIVDTGLSPNYYDTDTLILHANFNLLKRFVEIEKANMYRFCHASSEEAPSTLRELMSRPKKLNPLNGIKYLEWETTLDASDEPHERNESQAAAAREILELYIWWVSDRPNRVELLAPEEPENDSGRSVMHRMSNSYREKYPEYYAAFQQWCTDHSKQEEDWANEDTEMLIRLMKIRKSLWT